MVDIYFEPYHGKLCERIEKGQCGIFNFECEIGKISNMFIKREIPLKVDGKSYYDIITPYGYGGPLILRCEEGRKDELVKNFGEAFREYCIRNDIVCEFVRFHPVVGNAKDFGSIYKLDNLRYTVGTNLSDNDDPVASEFSKGARKSIRRALRTGVTFRVTDAPECMKVFKKIYFSTMDRNNADRYYYFDDEYFDLCLEQLQDNIIFSEAIYDGKVVAMGLYFIYGKTIHIHLTGTLSEYMYLSPSYILRYAITLWGKDNGYELIHHGGGKTCCPEDSLYKFKKQFGSNTKFEYYKGKRIWNEEVYGNLCVLAGKKENGDYFPAYRQK